MPDSVEVLPTGPLRDNGCFRPKAAPAGRQEFSLASIKALPPRSRHSLIAPCPRPGILSPPRQHGRSINRTPLRSIIGQDFEQVAKELCRGTLRTPPPPSYAPPARSLPQAPNRPSAAVDAEGAGGSRCESQAHGAWRRADRPKFLVQTHRPAPRSPATAARGTALDAPPVESSAEVQVGRTRTRSSTTTYRTLQRTPRPIGNECGLQTRAGGSGDARKRLQPAELSARSTHCILRLARTIADLAGSTGILAPHVAEAIGYWRVERAVVARVA